MTKTHPSSSKPLSDPFDYSWKTPTFQNSFMPAAPRTLPPAYMPTPTQSSTALVPSSPAPRLPSRETLGGGRNLFDPSFASSTSHQLVPRTQVIVFPQQSSTSLSKFRPNLQARYPEAYALARHIDQFGKEQVALFRITLEKYQQPRQLFREFSAPSNLPERAIDLSLQTLMLRPQVSETSRLKLQAIAVGIWDTTSSFVIESFKHPIQSRIDLSIGAVKRAGHYLKEGMKLLVNTRDPKDVISRDMVETIDTVAANLDRLFTSWIQKHNPCHNPNSASVKVGGMTFDIIAWETGLRLLRGAKVVRAVEGFPLTSERLAIQAQATLQREALALERLTQPVLRSGIVRDKTVANLAQQQLRKSQIIFNFSGSAAKQLSRQERTIPMYILKDVIKNPIAVTRDPRGTLKGSRMYYSRMYRNGKLYNVEVLYNKTTNQIDHFMYDADALGPLGKIKNN